MFGKEYGTDLMMLLGEIMFRNYESEKLCSEVSQVGSVPERGRVSRSYKGVMHRCLFYFYIRGNSPKFHEMLNRT